MTDPTEIARVAAGLTRAQREALVHEKAGDIAHGWARMGTLEALWRKSILRRETGPGAFYSPQVFITWPLTPLGLAVRDHILREKSGEGDAL